MIHTYPNLYAYICQYPLAKLEPCNIKKFRYNAFLLLKNTAYSEYNDIWRLQKCFQMLWGSQVLPKIKSTRLLKLKVK